MSTFDLNNFLNTEITEANSTTYVPVPEYDEVPASIKAIVPRTAGDKPILDVQWSIDDDEAREVTGMAEPMARQTIWLDVTESGGLDFRKGRNVQLGKLREALGQNVSGKPWQPGMLVGGVGKVKVKHSIDKRDGETINANVVSVLPL
jgi:hypothetical protein